MKLFAKIYEQYLRPHRADAHGDVKSLQQLWGLGMASPRASALTDAITSQNRPLAITSQNRPLNIN